MTELVFLGELSVEKPTEITLFLCAYLLLGLLKQAIYLFVCVGGVSM